MSEGCRVMVFNVTFNNISVITWRSVLLVEESGEPGENHRPVGSGVKHHNREFRIDELHHNVVCISAYYITVFVFQITNSIFVKDNFI
jgi:hypothetical protein